MRDHIATLASGYRQRRHSGRRLVRLAAMAAISAMASRAVADTYTWTAAPNAIWESSANWTSSSGVGTFPHSIDDVAQFNSSSSTPGTVKFSSALTVGTLSITNNTTSSYNLNGSDFGGVITFQNSTGAAQVIANLQQLGNPNNSRIFAGIVLGSDLAVTQTGAGRLGIGDVTSSLNLVGHTLTASGLVGLSTTISNANGTTSLSAGGVTVSGGDVQLRNSLNSYASVTTVTGGVLSVNVSSGLVDIGLPSDIGVGLPGANGTTAAAVVLNRQSLVLDGGTFQYSIQASATSNRLFTLGSTGTIENNGTAATSIVLNNTNAIGFTGTSSHLLVLSGEGGSTSASMFSPQIPDDTANGLTTQLRKTAGGVWIVNNPANTYTGGTVVGGGTLRIGVDNGVSPFGPLTIVNSTNDATFDLFGHNQAVAGRG